MGMVNKDEGKSNPIYQTRDPLLRKASNRGTDTPNTIRHDVLITMAVISMNQELPRVGRVKQVGSSKR